MFNIMRDRTRCYYSSTSISDRVSQCNASRLDAADQSSHTHDLVPRGRGFPVADQPQLLWVCLCLGGARRFPASGRGTRCNPLSTTEPGLPRATYKRRAFGTARLDVA